MCVTEVTSKFCPTCDRKVSEGRMKYACDGIMNRFSYGSCENGERFRTTSVHRSQPCADCKAEERRRKRGQDKEDRERRRREREARTHARRNTRSYGL